MKRIVLLVITLLFLTLPVLASESTTYSYTISLNNDWTRTQNAYMPGAIFLMDKGLNEPNDFCIRGTTMYVADTGNSRIFVYDTKTKESHDIGKNILKKPTGVCIDKDGMIYVADFDAKAVYKFSPQGEQLMTITKPNSSLFGKDAAYNPQKVLVDSYGNLYVVSDGSYDGMLLFDPKGTFTGYFGSNKASMSFLQKIEEQIFTQEQLSKLLSRTPPVITNACLGPEGLIYSVTQNDHGDGVKALNMTGDNVLNMRGKLVDESDFVDVALSKTNEVYALSGSGFINEYDPDGSLVFAFGGQSLTTERSGLSTVATAIDVDDNQVLYVLDKERNLIQAFYPTQYALDTHEAIQTLSKGQYKTSRGEWETLLHQNGMSRSAHEGYARCCLLQGDYKEAMNHYYLAKDQENYSTAFWEQRRQWLNNNMMVILIVLFSLIAFLIVFSRLNKKFKILAPVGRRWQKRRDKPGFLRNMLYMKYMVRHPIDGYYELKKRRAGSMISATVIYLLAFVIFIWNMMFCGFIFRKADPTRTPLVSLVVVFFALLLLFVIGNTLVSSVSNGKGTFRQIYIMTAYAMSAYVLFTPIMTLLTYVLSLNESVIINLFFFLIIADCAISLFLGIRETHSYEGRQIWLNLFLTLFFMVMAIVAICILYLLWGQIVEFLKTLVSEVIYRVKN